MSLRHPVVASMNVLASFAKKHYTIETGFWECVPVTARIMLIETALVIVNQYDSK